METLAAKPVANAAKRAVTLRRNMQHLPIAPPRGHDIGLDYPVKHWLPAAARQSCRFYRVKRCFLRMAGVDPPMARLAGGSVGEHGLISARRGLGCLPGLLRRINDRPRTADGPAANHSLGQKQVVFATELGERALDDPFQ
jgi:hypothetical protein